ncbi:MAG TPA: putative glycolipid-binding domain-containing protein [Aliidongia sp.]|nr:putative glycolipid-binding domain-containing protein [Aliidongia sp.]
MRRDIVWEWLDRPGLEHLALEVGPDAVRASGLVVVQLGPEPLRVAYDVALDGTWRFERARLIVEGRGTSTALAIEHAADGRWTVDGRERPDLADCVDIDIMASPFTNSLPIHRLDLEPGQPRTLQVAYVRLPELSVEAMAQAYTRLDPGDPPTAFRYLSCASGFTADLAVDGDGLVVDYPGIWRRRAG